MQNLWAAKFDQGQMGQRQQTPMPTPDMKQATGTPNTAPSPFPQSGFAKQGAMQAQSPIPGLMGGGDQ